MITESSMAMILQKIGNKKYNFTRIKCDIIEIFSLVSTFHLIVKGIEFSCHET